MKKGFTLIELMIVVAIIAIIAAIAIPNLLSSRISANETTALGGLRTLVSCQATWRQQDSDGNGMQDHWVYDVSCFYRMLRADGATRVEAIDVSFAKADNYPALAATLGAAIAADLQVVPGVPTSKGGYLYGVIALDVAGVAYGVNPFQRGLAPNTAVGNNFSWGVSAAPEVYATSGVRVFIVNQSGTLYAVDPGGALNIWSIGGGLLGGNAGANKWPGNALLNDPTALGLDGTIASSPKWATVQ